MIKAEELRIGNLIQDLETEPYYFEVEELRKYVGYSIWAFYRKGSVKAKEVDPIPLTEDWLKRFGFERLVGWLDVWYRDGFDRFELTEIRDEYFFNDTKIEFVHQLQNAFFCIEQTELTPSDGGKIE